MKASKIIAAVLIGSISVAATPALACRKHPCARTKQAVVAAVPRAPSSFYPNEIAGGVSGNLPFNNQIRKLSDPLNANGGGR